MRRDNAAHTAGIVCSCIHELFSSHLQSSCGDDSPAAVSGGGGGARAQRDPIVTVSRPNKLNLSGQSIETTPSLKADTEKRLIASQRSINQISADWANGRESGGRRGRGRRARGRRRGGSERGGSGEAVSVCECYAQRASIAI